MIKKYLIVFSIARSEAWNFRSVINNFFCFSYCFFLLNKVCSELSEDSWTVSGLSVRRLISSQWVFKVDGGSTRILYCCARVGRLNSLLLSWYNYRRQIMAHPKAQSMYDSKSQNKKFMFSLKKIFHFKDWLQKGLFMPYLGEEIGHDFFSGSHVVFKFWTHVQKA